MEITREPTSEQVCGETDPLIGIAIICFFLLMIALEPFFLKLYLKYTKKNDSNMEE